MSGTTIKKIIFLGTLLFISFIFISFKCTGEQHMKTRQPREVILEYSLKVEERYHVGREANLEFALKNMTGQTLWVLTWYTPLEGLKGNIFRVTREGEAVLYTGRMVKRANPSKKDYVCIGPGKSVSATVDLSHGYDLSKPGEYRVEFSGRILDMTFDEASLPRKMDLHKGMHLQGDAVTFTLIEP